MLDIGQENLRVSGRFYGHGGDDAVKTHGPQDGHDFPVAAGRGFMNAPTSESARIEPCHRSRNAALVKKYQLFRRDRADLGDKLFTPLAVGFCVALRGVE